MSDETIPDGAEVPLDVLERIDRICDGFEAAWERGERPRSEGCRGDIAEALRLALLRDLLAAELSARRRRGEHPDPRDYRERFSDHLETVDAAFGEPAAQDGDRADGAGSAPA
ncbi:MAG: hypothetical protein ACLQGP_18260 [Isosphaeraceae bacterium]